MMKKEKNAKITITAHQRDQLHPDLSLLGGGLTVASSLSKG